MIPHWFGWKRPPARLSSAVQSRTPQLIELRNVVKTYHSAAGALTALKGIDLQITPGEFVAEIGKSGSGAILGVPLSIG